MHWFRVTALTVAEAPTEAAHFVRQTFAVIQRGDLCEIAATFTFGREDLLPEVFTRIVEELNARARGELDDFLYYLNRHIELDGDHHGPLAARMLHSLCGDDPSRWEKAEAAAIAAFRARIALWDGVLDSIAGPARTV